MLDAKKTLAKILYRLNLIEDYVIEEGVSGIWKYRKWAGGLAECWGVNTGTGSFKAWGSIYSHDCPSVDYPADLFVSVEYLSGFAVYQGGNVVSSVENSPQGEPSSTVFPGIITIRGTKTTGTFTFTHHRYARGRWK